MDPTNYVRSISATTYLDSVKRTCLTNFNTTPPDTSYLQKMKLKRKTKISFLRKSHRKLTYYISLVLLSTKFYNKQAQAKKMNAKLNKPLTTCLWVFLWLDGFYMFSERNNSHGTFCYNPFHSCFVFNCRKTLYSYKTLLKLSLVNNLIKSKKTLPYVWIR